MNLQQFNIKKDIIPIHFSRNDEFQELYTNFCEMAQRINALVETTYEQDILNKEQELAILQTQINPHFIYNTFEILNSMAMSGHPDKICTVTKSLSNIMRYTINSQQFEVTLQDELAHVGDYIKIQQERFMGDLLYIQDVPSELLSKPIPKLTLQPIVENCISHAFKGQQRNRVITLSACMGNEQYRIDVTDNGCGIPPEQAAALFSPNAKADGPGNGVALKNINRRLQMKYGLESGLCVDSLPGFGTTISVIIALKES